MAELSDKVFKNVPGSYYVDESCIDCDMCRSTAPQLFTRDDESGYSYVLRQPVNADELTLAESAITDCPCGSIGSDGQG